VRLFRALAPWSVVFVLGLLMSFVVTALGSGLAEERALFGVHEPPESRQYMIKLLQQEPEGLIALTPKTDVVSRAMQFRQSETASGQIQAQSMTYLGGRTSGPLSVHIYAIEIRAGTGQRQFFPLALTLLQGKVVRRE
jgi:hypothetical protein